MKILSLFDGMACGMCAFQKAGIPVEEYNAYEIDKYAVKTAIHNFPNIKELGDVFNADFTKHKGIDFLIGGSPCTYWSIAQSPDKRETTASGMGWELFCQYVRALHEAKPKYFLYENNKSMATAIYQSISEAFGFEPILINSALVSAQNRQRYYWVGKREPDGTYSKVDIQQPEDRGILLKDVIESAEPVGETSDGKAYCFTARYYKGVGTNPGKVFDKHRDSMAAKSVCMRYERNETAKALYRVYNGKITIKEKEYPIKLNDGYYIIRKLTVRECMRLQTVPEWYEFPVSDTQAYKMLGNGWTVDVIAHILKGITNA